MTTQRARSVFIIIVIVFSSIFFSLSKGSTAIPLYQLLFSENGQIHSILWQLRLPRTLAAFTTGGLLALSGALMQLLLQNPLADPYALGIAGGAALCTLIMMLLGISTNWLIAGAWLGSLTAILFMLLLSHKHRWQTHTLLLAGIAMACGFSACISLILLLSPAASLHSMLFWLAGDLNDARSPWFSMIILGAGCLAALILAPGLNILTRGDLSARALGLPVQRYRIALYLLSALLTAAAVTLAGCIGFIGLIIPHLCRQLVGHDHRILLPASVLLGGSLLTLADTLARTAFAPLQLPVGMVIALFGAPLFIWLLQK